MAFRESGKEYFAVEGHRDTNYFHDYDGGRASWRRTKKPRWITKAIAEDISREEELRATFRELLVFIFFLIAICIATVGARDSSAFYLSEVLRDQFINKVFLTTASLNMTFSSISSHSDFWQYAEGLMLESFYYEHHSDQFSSVKVSADAENEKRMLYENKLLGVPRIRQVRVRNDSCTVHHYFGKELFESCYGPYSDKTVDKNWFGLGTGTQWRYQDAKQTGSLDYSGSISKYDGGGYYQDLSVKKSESAERIRELKDSLWISRNTRAVFVDFSIYNANLNLFGICKLVFELPPTGGIVTSSYINAVRLIQFVNQWDHFIFGCSVVSNLFVIFYLIEEIREIMYLKWKYFLHFWSYIDMAIILLGICAFVVVFLMWLSVEDALVKIKDHPTHYGNLEYHCTMKVAYKYLQGIQIFFVCIKIFKFLNFSKTMGQLNSTLNRCAVDMLVFFFMFLLIFLSFALLGFLIFGNQVVGFSSFPAAMFTLLRTILGDFQYKNVEKFSRYLSPLYFTGYIIFVFFLVMNMFLAILNDTYADVKTEIAIAPDQMQMMTFLRLTLLNLLHKCGCRITWAANKSEVNLTIHQIRNALKECGFNPLEIEMFFARYNIDPIAEVVGYDVNRLMLELDSQQPGGKEKINQNTSLIQLSDFVSQQERLTRIERSVKSLTSKVDFLILHFDSLDHLHRPRH